MTAEHGDEEERMISRIDHPNESQDQEQEPGVYVRSDAPDHDLDFLWDRERKKSVEHDRFHFGFFIGGMILGSIITLILCMLYFNGGKLFQQQQPEAPAPAVIENQGTSSAPATTSAAPASTSTTTTQTTKTASPPAETTTTTTTATAPQPQAPAPKPQSSGGFSLPFFGGPAKPAPAPAPVKPAESPRFYEVQSGDTLGRIALKFYNNAGPDSVKKIQSANQLSSPDAIKLGQHLTIPPKDSP